MFVHGRTVTVRTRGIGLLESEIASLLTTLAGSVVTDAWTSVVRPRLAALLGRGRQGQDGDLLAELEQLRAAAARSADGEQDGEQDGAVERVEALLRTTLGTLADQQASLLETLRELLAATAPASAEPSVPPARLSMLSVDDYENNEALLQAMHDAWEAGRGVPGPTVLYVYGARGLGRTALAGQFLLRHREAFAAGPELGATLARDAFGELPDNMAVLEGWFQDLRIPVQEVPAEPAARVRKFRQVTAQGPVFVLLEDVTVAAQIEELLPGSPDSVVVITSNALMRNLVSRFHAKAFRIEPLRPEHSRKLLVNAGGLAGFEACYEREIDRTLEVCEGNPLFLRIAGAQMFFDPPHSIEDFAAAVSDPDPRARLEAFDMDEVPGAGIFDTVYRDLGRRDPDAAAVYRCLGLHPTPEFDPDVVRAMLPDLPDAARTKAVRALADASLVVRTDDGSYRTVSGLVHAHAADRALADLSQDEREAVQGRWIQHYVDLAERSDAGLSPRHRHDPTHSYAAYPRVGADEQDSLVKELERRRRTLRIAVRTAYAAGRHHARYYEAAWRLPQGLWTFYLRCGFHSDWIETYTVACDAALECGDLLALARMRYGLGFAHLDRWSRESGDPEAARAQFGRALELVRPTPDRPEGSAQEAEGRRRTWSSVLEGLSILEGRLGNAREALELSAAALDALTGVDHPRGRALLALHRGPILTKLGRHDEAAAELRSAEQQFTELGDDFNTAKATFRYGQARLAAGDQAEALAAFDEALPGMKGRRNGYLRAQSLLVRGDLLRDRGDVRRARADWRDAAALLRDENSARVPEVEQRLADWPAPDGSDGGGPDGPGGPRASESGDVE